MALQNNGQISFGDINVEAGLSSNTANTKLAGGSTPSVGSLFGMFSSYGVDQTPPHKVSEFYGVSFGIPIYIKATIGIFDVTFDSLANSCGGTVTDTFCRIDINYDWQDANFNSGNDNAILYGGNNGTVTVTPTGATGVLQSVTVQNAVFNAGACSGYKTIMSICP